MKIYLAGPDVFLPDAVDIGRRKVALCARHGLIGLYPPENAVDRAANDASLQIFRGNEATRWLVAAQRLHRGQLRFGGAFRRGHRRCRAVSAMKLR
jgi:nucleoside 2-deoxyribosyltransferase